MTISCW